ncbi:tol-pal system protein YbgF [Comamonadaceae bacterium M7527]|nr:tol-pal system protein YbgF [Comamonadaceae bacterium M7527]
MATQLSHAALFEDEEARRAIIDLRQRMQVTQDQLSKIATSESILELANQNEQLRSELAQLRGQNEQLARAVDELRALVDSVDSRLSQLEPATVTVDNENFSVGPKEKADYETAMTALRGGNFEVAGGVLTTLLQEFPESGYVPSALFWLGNAYYATGQYSAALKTFNELTTKFAQHARVPEAMLAKANCQVELRDKRGAKTNLEALIRQFPSSEAAQAAKQRLDALK